MIEIIENTLEEIGKFHDHGWGGGTLEITKEHIQALLDGKAFAYFDGEYTHVLVLEKS